MTFSARGGGSGPNGWSRGGGVAGRAGRWRRGGARSGVGGKLLPRRAEFVADKIALRSASADSVAVIERDAGEMLGLVEAERPSTPVHPGAVYPHLGRSCEVDRVGNDERQALVSGYDGDWYTRPKKES